MVELAMFLGPVWIAFVLGIVVGWAWKPRWATLSHCKFELSAPSYPWSSVIVFPVKGFGSILNKVLQSSLGSSLTNSGLDKEQLKPPLEDSNNCSSSQLKKVESVVTEEDLEHLCHLVERKDGGRPWKHMIDRSTPTMNYQAWQRDAETGPTQYCSRTIYEDATSELLRDFFWDDEFRLEWDDMIIQATTIKECPTTGAMVVHWVRKFPFFCSNREYIIGRRIWKSGQSYYCVTKGVPCPLIPRHDKPRRVDVYYSSWSIQAVGSRESGQPTACKVILFHHEDMGIPWEIAKIGVRQGMWGAVRNIERGLRAYQRHRESGASLSRCAFMAQINTKIDPCYLKSLESDEKENTSDMNTLDSAEKPKGVNIPKLLLIGGAVVIACSLDQGLLRKTFIFSVARRFANIGRRAYPRAQ